MVTRAKKVTKEETVSEKEMVVKILHYLKTVPKCFAWKAHGGMYGTAGIPDIIACIAGLKSKHPWAKQRNCKRQRYVKSSPAAAPLWLFARLTRCEL